MYGELYHYNPNHDKLGRFTSGKELKTKWGFRKSQDQIKRKVDKLSRENENLEKKLNAKKEASQQERIRRADRILSKSAKLDKKSARLLSRSKPSLFVSKNRAFKNYTKGNKLAVKSQKLRARGTSLRSYASSYIARQNSYKARIENNKKVIHMLKNTSVAMDKNMIKQGKMFMQYVMEKDELYHYNPNHDKLGRFASGGGKPSILIPRFNTKSPDYKPMTPSKSVKEQRKQAKKEKIEDVKNRRAMSDEELNRKIKRLENEIKLKELTKEDVHNGKSFAKTVFAEGSKKAITQMVTGAELYLAKAIISGQYDKKQFGEALFNGGPKKK